ncbi:hypothetical protein ACOSQ4_015659 [Xanthoceras sorbifolium]
MPGLPREVRRSLTRYCPLWVVRGCPTTTPSRFCFASPKSGFEPLNLQRRRMRQQMALIHPQTRREPDRKLWRKREANMLRRA